MGLQTYQLVAGDWIGLERIINDLTGRVVGQTMGPTSSPTFAGLTLNSSTGILKRVVGVVQNAIAGTDYQRPIVFDVRDYGAIGNGVIDDTAAIQAAIQATFSANGGTVYFPNGNYKCVSALTIPNTAHGIHFKGESQTAVGTTSGCSIIYSGTASKFIYTLGSAESISFQNIKIVYTSGSFTGTLVDLAGTARVIIDYCSFGGIAVTSATYLIDLATTIEVDIRRSSFINSTYHIHGAPGTSTSTHISNCEFAAYVTAAILNPGSGWTIDGASYFAQSTTSTGAAIVMTGGNPTHGFVFKGNTCADATAVAAWTWLTLANLFGGEISGNIFVGETNLTPTAIKFTVASEGISIRGNYFSSFAKGVDIGTALLTNVENVANKYSSVTANISGTFAGAVTSYGDVFEYIGHGGSINTSELHSGGLLLQKVGEVSFELKSTDVGTHNYKHIANPSWKTGSYHFYDSTADASRIAIDSAGSVGIGTGTGTISAKLHVAGSIRTDNWYDVNGTAGISDSATGIVKNLTTSGGIITAKSFDSFGTNTYIPYANGTGFSYSANHTFNGSNVTLLGDYNFGGTAARQILHGRATSGAGNDFTISAGGAQSGGASLSGGNLILKGGLSTGGAGAVSEINFYLPNIDILLDDTDDNPQVLIAKIDTTPTGRTRFLISDDPAFTLDNNNVNAFQAYGNGTTGFRLVTATPASGTGSATLGTLNLLIRGRGTLAAIAKVLTGDRLGHFAFQGYDDDLTAKNAARFRVDCMGTIGSGRVPGKIVFSTFTDAATSVEVDAVVIDCAQNVGIGVASPTVRLDVSGQITSNNIVTGTYFQTSTAITANSTGTVVIVAKDANLLTANAGWMPFKKSDGTTVYVPYWA
jgi:hypothetical protein